jgi:hypothetical protein
MKKYILSLVIILFLTSPSFANSTGVMPGHGGYQPGSSPSFDSVSGLMALINNDYTGTGSIVLDTDPEFQNTVTVNGVLKSHSPLHIVDGLNFLTGVGGAELFHIFVSGVMTEDTGLNAAFDNCLVQETNGGNANDMEMMFFDDSANRPLLTLSIGGIGNASFIERSLVIGDGKGDKTLDANYIDFSTSYPNLSFDTTGLGADLGVEHDLEVLNKIWTSTMEVSGTAQAAKGYIVADVEVLLHVLRNSDTQDGTTSAGILFGVRDKAVGITQQNKGAILFNRTGGWGTGDMIFAVDSTLDNGNATKEDAAMVIRSTGAVGIGVAVPVEKLEVNGNIKIKAGGELFTEMVTARDEAGLLLTEDGGEGIFIEDATGDIGIGIVTPSKKLHVKGDTNSGVLVKQGSQVDPDDLANTFWSGLAFQNWNTTHSYSMGYSTGGDFGIFRFDGTDTYMTMFTILQEGQVGIGTATPSTPLDVHSSGNNQISCIDTDAQAAGTGGGIIFGGKHTDAGDIALGGRIEIEKETSVSGEYGFDMVFDTQEDGGTLTERLRLTGDNEAIFPGKLGIGIVSPTELLHVQDGNVLFQESTVGTPISLLIHHSDGTNGASHATLQLKTEEAAGGDPLIRWTIGNQSGDWVMGIDNGDTDALKIASSSQLDSETRVTIHQTTGNVGIGNISATVKLEVDGAVAFKRVGTSGSSNTAAMGEAHIYAILSTSTARTMTISSADITLGRQFIIKDESGGAGTNNITIATEGSQLINGNSTLTITVNYGNYRLYSDGTNLFTF